jgi:hypothetical protein
MTCKTTRAAIAATAGLATAPTAPVLAQAEAPPVGATQAARIDEGLKRRAMGRLAEKAPAQ